MNRYDHEYYDNDYEEIKYFVVEKKVYEATSKEEAFLKHTKCMFPENTDFLNRSFQSLYDEYTEIENECVKPTIISLEDIKQL